MSIQHETSSTVVPAHQPIPNLSQLKQTLNEGKIDWDPSTISFGILPSDKDAIQTYECSLTEITFEYQAGSLWQLYFESSDQQTLVNHEFIGHSPGNCTGIINDHHASVDGYHLLSNHFYAELYEVYSRTEYEEFNSFEPLVRKVHNIPIHERFFFYEITMQLLHPDNRARTNTVALVKHMQYKMGDDLTNSREQELYNHVLDMEVNVPNEVPEHSQVITNTPTEPFKVQSRIQQLLKEHSPESICIASPIVDASIGDQLLNLCEENNTSVTMVLDNDAADNMTNQSINGIAQDMIKSPNINVSRYPDSLTTAIMVLDDYFCVMTMDYHNQPEALMISDYQPGFDWAINHFDNIESKSTLSLKQAPNVTTT